MFNNPKQHILQVSELTKKVRYILESELSVVWLCGEISNFIAASSGHWYLSLKDAKSQVRCAMFKGNNRSVRIKPANGKQVLVKARVSLYEPRGDFQLIIEQMQDAGEGVLQQKYEQLKAQLQAEGLFEQRYKQPIPEYVQTIGVVTSPTGAAVHDILNVLNRRNPGIKVIIYPTLVQGEGASEQIADAIYTAYERDEVDALIVGRGGGSLEDLWSFNEEAVVRAIFDCDIPIISAVGHEVDTSLSDYVADMRAPTPSAAAEILSKDTGIQRRQIQAMNQALRLNASAIVHRLRHRQQQLLQRLSMQSPVAQLRLQQQKSDDLQIRLINCLKEQHQQRINQQQLLAQRLSSATPARQLPLHATHLADLSTRLKKAMLHSKDNKHMRLAMLAQSLNLVSPLATIGRGYSISRDNDGKVIRSIEQINTGDAISVQVNDGQIIAQVTERTDKR
ncbi:exodeoxyribonuclease VII large subunit [Thalassotalea sp. Y01]|uniref:exodeoxyribonuclease VII large subunit n=1 Tax=Thalassotalea sp. Y01 TaxID=2729613 RepID=UPI00145CF302|nr:exodeoxyribonuclease VII large subunit [Thalassotalea sp. Y01]NMP15985.1 exodeoxyribonuclease VII large subunit [Thalassotalea sp. Y01]